MSSHVILYRMHREWASYIVFRILLLLVLFRFSISLISCKVKSDLFAATEWISLITKSVFALKSNLSFHRCWNKWRQFMANFRRTPKCIVRTFQFSLSYWIKINTFRDLIRKLKIHSNLPRPNHWFQPDSCAKERRGTFSCWLISFPQHA